MGGSGGSSEDQMSIEMEIVKDCAHEVPDGNKKSIDNWTRGHSCTFW
jgi:hypothetical protein